MKNMNCPICHMKIYSDFGKSCKICGMILEDKSREFCSKKCRKVHQKLTNKIL
jgi:endogenous inhibitor of DNA gyrase (YacG/DUF329 family)